MHDNLYIFIMVVPLIFIILIIIRKLLPPVLSVFCPLIRKYRVFFCFFHVSMCLNDVFGFFFVQDGEKTTVIKSIKPS